jgi:hypothetical protein
LATSDLPKNITSLTLTNSGLNLASVPDTIKKLKIIFSNYHYMEPIFVIPETVTSLTIIGSTAVNRICNNLPKNVTKLSLDKLPDESHMMPLTIKKLTIGTDSPNAIICEDYFSLSSITHLTFNRFFAQQINNCLPSSITHLKFGKHFNKSIDKIIPPSVIHLTFGYQFNQPIISKLPSSIRYLEFGYNFNQLIDDIIPDFVTHLIFGENFNKYLHGIDDDGNLISYIPTSVTHLTIKSNIYLTEKIIPKSVTHLVFMSHFNNPIANIIPYGVTHLILSDLFNQSIENVIPKSVTHLTFGDNFNQPLYKYLPPFITHLSFGDSFNQPLYDFLPLSIIHLSFGKNFNQDLYECIPSSVTHLNLSLTHYDHPIIRGEKRFGKPTKKVPWHRLLPNVVDLRLI